MSFPCKRDKLNDAHKKKVLQLFASGIKVHVIAIRFGVSRNVITKIVKGKING